MFYVAAADCVNAGLGDAQDRADEIIANVTTSVGYAADRGLELFWCTIPGFDGYEFGAPEEASQARVLANNWLRANAATLGFGLIDCERALGDPSTGYRELLPAYDSGDGLHINDAGALALRPIFDEAINGFNR